MVRRMTELTQGVGETFREVQSRKQANPWPRSEPLRLRKVTLERGSTEILHGIDLTFEPGSRYVITGPSGSGKSTLLRLLNRLEDPSSGEILVGTTPLKQLPVGLVRRSIGLVFQTPRPFPGSVRDNLCYPWFIQKLLPPSDATIQRTLERVGLKSLAFERDAIGLSGGERQRLALAVALQTDPEILALDEPTASLDPEMARTIATLLEILSKETGIRTITVCHQPELVPLLGDFRITMSAGQVVGLEPNGPVVMKPRDTDFKANQVTAPTRNPDESTA